MTAPGARFMPVHRPDDTTRDECWLWCPACEDLHPIHFGPNGWGWDGNADAPTFTGSILAKGARDGSDWLCHSFIRAGQWEFLSDCTHALAGQTAPMAPFPDWLQETWGGAE